VTVAPAGQEESRGSNVSSIGHTLRSWGRGKVIAKACSVWKGLAEDLCRAIVYEAFLSVSVHRHEKGLNLLQESGEVKTRSMYVTKRNRQIQPWCCNSSLGNVFLLVEWYL
jgi:hypothetical protein